MYTASCSRRYDGRYLAIYYTTRRYIILFAFFFGPEQQRAHDGGTPQHATYDVRCIYNRRQVFISPSRHVVWH